MTQEEKLHSIQLAEEDILAGRLISLEEMKIRKLSKRFAGALQLTDEQYTDFQSSIQKGRAEWERNIY